MITTLPTAASVAEAAAAVAPHVRRTPVLRASLDGRPPAEARTPAARWILQAARCGERAATGPRPETSSPRREATTGIAVATAAASLAYPPPSYVPIPTPEGKTGRIEASRRRA